MTLTVSESYRVSKLQGLDVVEQNTCLESKIEFKNN